MIKKIVSKKNNIKCQEKIKENCLDLIKNKSQSNQECFYLKIYCFNYIIFKPVHRELIKRNTK
jgi:hypothetical protein